VPKTEKKFINPLLRPSATSPSTEPATETPTLPNTEASTYSATSTDTFTLPRRKRGAQAFERTHERITLWIERSLKAQFEALAERQDAAKSALLDEAIADLIQKYKGIR
jgi:hypothetical protein